MATISEPSPEGSPKPLTRENLAHMRRALTRADELRETEPGRAATIAANITTLYGWRLLAALEALMPPAAPPGHTLTRCKACQAYIIMAIHAKTGKVGPLDAEPSERGNCILAGDGTYSVLGRPDARADYAGRLHMNHFATCPHAGEFAK